MKLSDVMPEESSFKLSDVSAEPPSPTPGPINLKSAYDPKVAEMLRYEAPEAAKGLAGKVPGILGDIEQTGRTVGRFFGAPISKEPYLPTSEDISTAEFGPPIGQRGKESRGAGEFLGDFAVPSAAGKAIKAIPKIASIATDLWPGAARRGVALVDRISKPAADMTEIGKPIQQFLTDRLSNLLQARNAAFEPYRQALFSTDSETSAAVREKVISYLESQLSAAKSTHLSSAEALIQAGINEVSTRPLNMEGLDELRRFFGKAAEGKAEGFAGVKIALGGDLKEGVEKAMETVPSFRPYIDKWKELSEPINEFRTKLGKWATESETDYTPDISKVDPADLLRRAFRTNTTVENLTSLTGGNKELVDDLAREYVATDLNRILQGELRKQTSGILPYQRASNVANAARKWLDDKTVKGWLNAVPKVRDETKEYVSNLERIASRQRRASYIGGGAALAGLYEFGKTPINWTRHFLGLP